jgi:NDP-sugar pyrophosphorylase family protein
MKLDIYIPVGGYGKRLGAITKNIPKPLIKIDNEPFIIKLIRSFKKLKTKNFYLLTNYKEKQFFFLKKRLSNLKINFIKDKKKEGTFKSLYNCKKNFRNNFIYSNSDEILDLNINKVVQTFTKGKIDILQLFFKDNLGKNLDKKIVINKKKFDNKKRYTEAGLKIFKKNIFKNIKKNNYRSIEDFIEKNETVLNVKYLIIDKRPYSIDTWKRLRRTKLFLKKTKF